MRDAGTAYDLLDRPWQVALDEAWTSWRNGCAAVGAVISDSSGRIVSVGRNRTLEPRSDPGVLASTSLAHGEMNALALLPLGPTEDLTLTTTFEPCLMCASAIVQTGIPHVRYAAADPHFDGLHGWFGELPFARERLPQRTELGGPIGAFAHVLHLSWMCFWSADAARSHEAGHPDHVALARAIAHEDRLAGVTGGVVEAMEELWPALRQLSPPP